jgi:hypothetical protein
MLSLLNWITKKKFVSYDTFEPDLISTQFWAPRVPFNYLVKKHETGWENFLPTRVSFNFQPELDRRNSRSHWVENS